MKLRIAVVDDNRSVIDLIRGTIINGFAAYHIEAEVETFSSPLKFEEKRILAAYQLVFLDIHMPDMDGVDYARTLRQKSPETEIIFVSSKEERVFEAIQLQPFGFVRKSNFLTDISEVIGRYAASLKESPVSNMILLTVNGEKTNFSVENIIYFEGAGPKQVMHVKDSRDTFEVNSRMETLETMLSEYGFIRAHKGFLVNFFFISHFEGSDIVLQDGTLIPVSRRKNATIKDEFMALCKKYNVLTF